MSDGKVIQLKDGISKVEKQIQEVSDPWEIFTLTDAYQERDPLKYIIGGLFTLPSLSIVYGSPGTLKSMFLVDAMAHVAGGIPWLGREVIQSPALWIDFDNGRRRTHERIASVSRYLKLQENDPLYYVSMPNPPLDAGDTASIDALGDRITAKGIRFMVIDNLGLISPRSDENSDSMVKVMGNLRMLSEKTGCAIVIIHHQRKSKDGKSRPIGESLRGHSSIAGAIDLALLIKRGENSDSIEAHSTKTRDVEVYPFGAEYQFTHKGQTTELLTSTFVPCETEMDIANKELDDTIISIASESIAITQNALAKKVGQVGQTSVTNAKKRIRYLGDHGILLVKDGPNKSLLYSVKSIRELQ